jgi:hypothetical protein
VSGPPVIYLDPRVLASMKTEPDPDAPVSLVMYYSNEYTRALVDSARGGDEFFIQIELSNGGIMFALTNYGRIFRQSVGAPAWETVDVPDFGGSPET